MNLEKIGKLIAMRRKELGLSQKDLSNKLGITDKAVSKWERGINAPDISYLKDLSDLLQISLNDLLSGEINNTNDMNVETIKFYNKKFKEKYLKNFIIIFLVSLFLFLSIIVINDYNRLTIYDINSLNGDFIINGHLIFNKKNNIIMISDMEYIDNYAGTSKALIIKNLDIFLKSDNKVIVSFHYDIDDEKNVLLEEFLVGKTIYLEENVNNNEDIHIYNNEDLQLVFVYTNVDDIENSIVVPLKVKNVK